MSVLGDEVLSGLASVGMGAVTGAAGGPIGMVIGGLAGVAKSVAPEIAKWLGASDDTVAAAEKAVASVTGQTDPNAALTALNNDPTMTATLRLQLADIATQQQAEENRALESRMQMSMADFSDARKRDIEITKSGKRNTRADIMLGITVLGIVALIAVSIIYKLDGNSAIFGLIAGTIGVLVKCYADAFQFEFGSSRGSQDKSDTIANMAMNTTPIKMLPNPAKIEPAK